MAYRAKVRMYRQGLGDCFLVTLPRRTGEPYYVMIDCGVVLGTSKSAELMKAVVKDIIQTTHGHLNLLVVTHEHWDHLSGFIQAKELLPGLTVDAVWLAWTENPNDELANRIRREHQRLRAALASAAARMRFSGAKDSYLDGILEFFGAATSGSTGQALEIVKGLSPGSIRFCLPDDAPVSPEGVDARFYVLGPPRDEAALRRSDPSARRPETYGMAAQRMQALGSAVLDGEADAPFEPGVRIPLDVAAQTMFFQTHYWGEAQGSAQRDQEWRRIDGDWLDAASSLGLQLDNATNNTSLVLAIELTGGDVLLFAADAQVGNWLSWRDLTWHVEADTVTGPDLLARTILYKTGHHGSHNATLRENGLEIMAKNLQFALIPVDQDTAIRKRWAKMPLLELESRLNEITKGRVLRADRDVPEALAGSVSQDPGRVLYFEVTV
jgi:hypothetical protein